MGSIFQTVLQMSFYGSIAIIVVLILRKCFHKLPKRISCYFWLIPGFRLLCPLNFNTIFSVMNIAKLSDHTNETINQTAGAVIPQLTGRTAPTQPVPNAAGTAGTGMSAVWRDPMTVMALIWLIGMAAIMIWLSGKTIRMMRDLKTAKRVRRGNYYVSDAVDTSFVLGIFRPRIYMQSQLTEREAAYILQHERMHIRNLDHITRIVGVLILCMHWFNPFVWIGFAKLCADLEMRCDEAVIDRMGDTIKKDYCRSMVSHACDRGRGSRGVYAAFAGDNYNGREIKMRIKNLAGYKRVSKIAAVSVIVFALGLTVVLSTKAQNRSDQGKAAEQTETAQIRVESSEESSAEEKTGEAVSTPGNLPVETPEENLENYGKEELLIPDDVIYSDEGRPFSKTYDYRDTPVLSRLGSLMEQEGFEIESSDTEYLDQDGNVQTGRELYTFSAYKEDEKGSMFVNFYMVSEEYAMEMFDDLKEKDGIWYAESGNGGVENSWQVIRTYDPKTGVMMDASGNYAFDWESIWPLKDREAK